MEKTIYLEGDKKIIKEILEIARNNLGQGINAVDLTPRVNLQEVNELIEEYFNENLDECMNDCEELKNKIAKLGGSQ